ncbi:MAG TPA: hypothetical protein VMR59_02355 [Patescibacteria group bacterium]|jgi:hypothetical protein|nr:hypothetical protein [Patescibacteria group bacterium]
MTQDGGGIDRPTTFSPLLSEHVASSGDYVAKLDRSPFRGSRILRKAAPYIESGQFAEGVDTISAELARRGIGFEYVPRGTSSRGTRVEPNGREVMILTDDFKRSPPAKALHSLLHRNASLILQRDKLWNDPHYMKVLLEMDVAYAESARLGATRIADPVERSRTQGIASDIEVEANMKILAKERQIALEPRRGKV